MTIDEEYTKESFALAVRRIRQRTRCSQDKLAELINLSAQTIRKWENAKSMPKTPKETILMIEYEIEQWKKQQDQGPPSRFKIVRSKNPDFIEFVRNMRETAQLSIAELAKKMGESTWDLVALEQGEKMPTDKDQFIKNLRTVTKIEIKRKREQKEN